MGIKESKDWNIDALFIEFGIKGRDDFERIKSRFDPEDIRRIL